MLTALFLSAIIKMTFLTTLTTLFNFPSYEISGKAHYVVLLRHSSWNEISDYAHYTVLLPYY